MHDPEFGIAPEHGYQRLARAQPRQQRGKLDLPDEVRGQEGLGYQQHSRVRGAQTGLDLMVPFLAWL